MAHFEATTSTAGVLSAADKQIIDDLSGAGTVLSIVWFHLLPQPASSGTPANAQEGSPSYAAKARFIFNFDRLNIPNTTLSGKIYARAYLGSAGSGDVRLYNVTDATELGVINYTETSATTKEATLSSIPTSGTKIIEVQVRKASGPGNTIVETASCDFLLSS